MNADKTPSPSADLLKWLGERRDGFLVGGAVLYGLGYLVWSYNAWRNHLGQLPAIEFQYLMAGVVPAFILLIAWAATGYFSSIRDKTIAIFERYKALRLGSLIACFVIAAVTSNMTALIDKGWISIGVTKQQLFNYTSPVVLVLAYLSLLPYLTPEHYKGTYVGVQLRVYQYAIPVAFCWYSLVLYFELYPRLPQELGGPEPRYAYVSLVQDEIAPSLLSALVSDRPTDAAPNSKPKVVRSSKLRVYFSNSDYMLVRTTANSAAAGGNLKDVPLYELRKDVIRAIEWLPD